MTHAEQRLPPLRPTDATALAALLDLSPDGVVVVDRSGSVRRANDRASELFRCAPDVLLGLTVDELVPEHLREVHREERAGFHHRPSRRSMGSGCTLQGLRGDGTTFPVDISLQPILVEGEPLVVAVVRDLTGHHELRRRNHQLAHDAEMLRRFVDVASHELRTPLTSVIGFAETLQAHPDLDSDVRSDAIERLLRNARRQEALISGLLDLSRVHNGKLPMTIRALDLTAIVTEVVDAFDGVEISLAIPQGTRVLADELRLEQVLTNLLANAVRYGAAPISIEARPPECCTTSDVWFSVCDGGPGIEVSFEASLFDAFSQQPGRDRHGSTGLGLGLYLTHELVSNMGGSITYRANQPTGSCFEVRLPAAPGAER